MSAQTFRCCPHCADDQPHIEKDTHELPCTLCYGDVERHTAAHRLHELDQLAAEVAESAAEDGMTWADASSCPTGLDQDYIAAFDPTTARALITEVLVLREQRDKRDDYPEPACLIHDVSGEDVRGWEAAECTCTRTRVGELTAEVARLRESGRTLGRTIDRWGALIIAATGSQDITDATGDGDWGIIEERLAEVPAALRKAEAIAEAAREFVDAERAWASDGDKPPAAAWNALIAAVDAERAEREGKS